MMPHPSQGRLHCQVCIVHELLRSSGSCTLDITEDEPIDPNTIPLSPSGSAVHRLAHLSPPLSQPPTVSGTYSSPLYRQTSAALPNSMPEVPDSTLKAQSVTPPSATPSIAPPKKVSKLSQLASARAASRASSDTRSTASSDRLSYASTEKSGPSGTHVAEGSVRTFPELRPVSGSAYPTSPRHSTATPSGLSTMSSAVHRAINTAMELEAFDTNYAPRVPVKEQPRRPSAPEPPTTPESVYSTDSRSTESRSTESRSESRSTISRSDSRSSASGSTIRTATPIRSPTQLSSTPPTLPPKDHRPVTAASTTSSSVTTSPSSSPKQAKQPSKLALLAQAKAQAKSASPQKLKPVQHIVDPDIGEIPEAGKQYTKYLDPVANGDAVTTAVTYSYESLRTLTSPSRRPSGAPHVVSLDEAEAAGKKTSKLAAKARNKKTVPVSAAVAEEKIRLVAGGSPEMFAAPSAKPAKPSAFAEVLATEDGRSVVSWGTGSTSSRTRAKSSSTTTIHIGDGSQSGKSKRRFVPAFTTPTAFDFSEPSRDDIVQRAREGTTLGSRQKSVKA
ncbi:hypothetical protein CYLTODRAFT_285889 [Cylindrobasidium torrendii FP15055 ss-10]|uniref:Uncharacterized protein n=1 Tax=Cylindrobasidium torrendii FP15055 ss-10 TaxID=1314674 RepID=A0A0D7BTP2_9AGAR|nr:hypothetical protein CYLTODRAFT_285889 [Cylindrobasidium torrendii FP15055 ss-10]